MDQTTSLINDAELILKAGMKELNHYKVQVEGNPNLELLDEHGTKLKITKEYVMNVIVPKLLKNNDRLERKIKSLKRMGVHE